MFVIRAEKYVLGLRLTKYVVVGVGMPVELSTFALSQLERPLNIPQSEC